MCTFIKSEKSLTTTKSKINKAYLKGKKIDN